MDPNEIKTKMMHQSWMDDYQRQQNSGLTIRAWCKQNNVLEKTFYYRLKVLRNEACALVEKNVPAVQATPSISPKFARVDFKPYDNTIGEGINIHCRDAHINISQNSNSEHVRMVLEAVFHA